MRPEPPGLHRRFCLLEAEFSHCFKAVIYVSGIARGKYGDGSELTPDSSPSYKDRA